MEKGLPRRALSGGPGLSFPELCSRFLGEYLDKIRLSVARLDEEQVWWRPHEGTNSVGNLMMHLCGNLSLWVLHALDQEPYRRDRAAEFAARSSQSKDRLLEQVRSVVERSQNAILNLSLKDLTAPRSIQGTRTDGMGALFHAVEHMSYHTGQIVFAVKQLVGERAPIEFYPQHRSE